MSESFWGTRCLSVFIISLWSRLDFSRLPEITVGRKAMSGDWSLQTMNVRREDLEPMATFGKRPRS